jgi:hypothetical protein
MVKPYAGKPPPMHLASLDATLDKARKTAPDMNVIGSGLYLWIVKRRKHRSHAIAQQLLLQPSE